MKTQICLAFAFLLASQFSFCQIPAGNLIAHFPLDGAGPDIIGGLTPIAVSGSPTATEDRFGTPASAMLFDGDDFLSYGDVLDLDASDFSVSAWARIDAVTPASIFSDRIVSKGVTSLGSPSLAGYALAVNDVGTDPLKANGSVGTSAGSVSAIESEINYGKWYHFTLTRCGPIIKNYVDGVIAGQDTILATDSISTNIYFAIGALVRAPSSGSDVLFFKGAIDEVLIYKNRCFSDHEVAQLACSTPQNNSTSVLGPNSAKLSWVGLDTIVGYQVQGGPLGSSAASFKTSDTTRTINILMPGTTYQWRARSWCGTRWSYWSNPTMFATPSLARTQNFKFIQSSSGLQLTQIGNTAYTKVFMFDVAGRMVAEAVIKADQSFVKTDFLPTGYYVIQVKGPDAAKHFKIFIP